MKEQIEAIVEGIIEYVLENCRVIGTDNPNAEVELDVSKELFDKQVKDFVKEIEELIK